MTEHKLIDCIEVCQEILIYQNNDDPDVGASNYRVMWECIMNCHREATCGGNELGSKEACISHCDGSLYSIYQLLRKDLLRIAKLHVLFSSDVMLRRLGILGEGEVIVDNLPIRDSAEIKIRI
ncbi:PREDICTED: uncharacterized protein LOC105362684 [Ceratosolen solmsi marchali]|uniref:Uncharacterized protein LOC105362684 n=1 Tax=Ceratosolen solmsi marchali TaxID=326594 RepID=A0AAJ6YI33_9HYME|nr:PREDICTED: uncharacterized protein LOC105362684 [Ceratosolen solmsi marchali]